MIAPERRGHGRTPDVEGPLNYDDMAADTIGFIEKVVGRPAHLVGWSDGGIVGLLVAIERPDLVRKLVVIGANYDLKGVPAELQEGLGAATADGEEMAMPRAMHVAVAPGGGPPAQYPVFRPSFRSLMRPPPCWMRASCSPRSRR